jgi:hypothetical protein
MLLNVTIGLVKRADCLLEASLAMVRANRCIF